MSRQNKQKKVIMSWEDYDFTDGSNWEEEQQQSNEDM